MSEIVEEQQANAAEPAVQSDKSEEASANQQQQPEPQEHHNEEGPIERSVKDEDAAKIENNDNEAITGDAAGSHHKPAEEIQEAEAPKENQDTKEMIEAEKKADKGVTLPAAENQEVTSSTKNDHPPKSEHLPKNVRSSRRPSYPISRSGFQNYGLTYLPYKSNFEPSEDARRRADEFFKTLKL